MISRPEYLIIGSGLTGSVIARLLRDAGHSVLILERRAHTAGNIYDETHPSGIRIHTYGPHYFRTSSDKIWNFVRRFAEFYRYEPALKSWVDGRYENWPVAESYIKKLIGEKWSPSFQGEPSNLEEASLAIMPREVYVKFVKGYTEKQWGVPASALSAELVQRFDVRADDEPRLTRHTYQGIPEEGYAAMMSRMLEGIPVMLNCDYHLCRSDFAPMRGTIYTGAIDEYFGYDLGRLKYRCQQRSHEYFPDLEYAQPCGQVNNPDPGEGPHIRTLEWKHMMRPEHAQHLRGTVLTREVPATSQSPNENEYPFPDQSNRDLYNAYRARAQGIAHLTICGRLGDYRYYDMDVAIGRAFSMAEKILAANGSPAQELIQ